MTSTGAISSPRDARLPARLRQELARRAILFLGALALIPLGARSAVASDPSHHLTVLIVANNKSIDPQVRDLNYADDDGLLFYQFFAHFADEVRLLTVLDDDTQKRAPRMAAITLDPTRENLQDAMAEIRRQTEALPASTQTELFFIFVGHGSVDPEGKGYVHLADGPLTRADLFHDIIAPSPADFTHLIVDACNAFSFVGGRGDDSEPAPVALAQQFLAGHDLEAYPTVGALLATSDNRETHEWSRIRAGLFSHQVRSALAGAADVNQDGRIEYSEVAAFVDAANSGLQAYGRQVRVFAWPPQQNRSQPLVDLRRAPDLHFLRLEAGLTGRFSVESSKGERWVELHKPAGKSVLLALPARERLFLRDQEHEVAIPTDEELVTIDQPPRDALSVRPRGALDEAFEGGLFGRPFTSDYYRGFVSGRDQFVPVVDATEPFSPATAPPAAERTWVIEVSYHGGLFMLQPDYFEHGPGARVLWHLGHGFYLTAASELGYTHLDRQKSRDAVRFALMPGLEYRRYLATGWSVCVGLELGYGLVSLWGEVTSSDYTVFGGRLFTGVGLEITDSAALRLYLGGAGFVTTVDGREGLFGRPEARLALAFFL